MPEPGLITGYLDDLDRALHLPRRYRRRVLAEAREHLVDSADHEIESGEPAGQAEATAVARFGPVPVVTAAFHRRWASRAVQTSLLVVAAAALPAIAAQALGSPLFWHLAGGGLRPAGPWPIPVKDGLVLVADFRAAADVAALCALVAAVTGTVARRRHGSGRDWPIALFGLVAAVALGAGAVAGLLELSMASGFGPHGARLWAAAGLLLVAGAGAGGAVVGAGWRLWAVRTGWIPARGLWADWVAQWAAWSPRARRGVRRGLILAVPGLLAVTLAAIVVEGIGQGNLRSAANDPQQAVAAAAARQLAAGLDPAAVATGAKVDLAHSLGVHITVFDASGRILASTAVLDGRTPVPPGGVLRTASRRTDVVTWQPQPAVRVAAVATSWSGPTGRGTVVVGRSLRVVEQRESRLIRNIARWWLIGLTLVALAALAWAWWPPRPRAGRRARRGAAGVAPA